MPYAIGAKLAAPERPVYLISGDGAIGFNIQELETARVTALIIVIVAVDEGWGMERSSQMMAQMPAFVETELSPGIRCDQIAAAFGCHGEMVTGLDGLQPAQRAAAADRPRSSRSWWTGDQHGAARPA
ncbi:MAG: hypothetical protein IPO15_15370 [Anaerolineae bacterium]|nr:hypothetical protein [Anaerolineae bacterium]